MDGAGAPPPSDRERLGRSRNQARILDAAEAVFAEAGFAGAAMQAIAERAGLPKANIHYYFRTKELLYRAVLARILELWLAALDHFHLAADPAAAVEAYVHDKLRWSRERPAASKVFANELLHGAPELEPFLSGEMRQRVAEKVRVVESWAAAGRIAPVDPWHLFFLLWAATQTYADFEVQIRAVLGRPHLTDADYAEAARQVTLIVQRGLGLKGKASPN